MSEVGEREIKTQRRVVRFFRDALGCGCLGECTDRPGNANIEQDILASWLRLQGHNDKITSRVIELLRKAASVGGVTILYDANREVYGLPRYGVKVQPKPGEHARTIWLIDWNNPHNNDFAIAEEVAVEDAGDKRPDVVL